HDEQACLRVMGYKVRYGIGANRSRSPKPPPLEPVTAHRRFPQLGYLQSWQCALETVLLAANRHFPDIRRNSSGKRFTNALLAIWQQAQTADYLANSFWRQ